MNRHSGISITAVAVVAAVLTACGSSTTTVTSTATRTVTSAAQTSATTTAQAGIDTMPTASTRPVHVAARNTRTALLSAVRVARHEGFDRVVFQFRANVLPGYDVRYVRKPLHEDGSGRVVPVRGAYAVRIRMENALDADLSREGAPRTYTGPTRIRPATPVLAELVKTGGFESILTWTAGLRNRVDFRVTALRSPARLVVDFRNH